MIEQSAVSLGQESIHVRQNDAAQGMRHSMAVREGLALTMADRIYAEDAEYEHFGGEYLKFHYKLAGQTAIRAEKGDFLPVEAGNLSMLVQPRDSLKCEKVQVNTQERSVTLICTRDFASSIIANSAENLPDEIGDYLRDRTSRFSLSSRRLLPSMRNLVEDILNPPMTDGLRAMLLEAKALELLYHTVQHILDVPTGTENVRPRDRAKVRDLCALFEENPGSNHSIGELCKLLAWNETQMMECFKLVTGTTISSYRHKVRMANARRQLQDTEASITEIAFDAGYEHPSNFATAFRRTFGHPPKMERIRYS